MSEKPNKDDKDKKPIVDPVDASKVEDVADKIEDIKEEIKKTPEEDKDAQWRASLTSTLETLTEEIRSLKETKGANAELAAMQQQVNRLATVLEEFTSQKNLPAALPKPAPVEGDPSSQETPKETLSETVQPEPKKESPPERKNKREWL